MTTYNDFKPEVQSLITRLEDNGFTIKSGDNGEEGFTLEELTMKQFVENLTATDESWLYVSRQGFGFALYLVLGNCPGEIVNDIRYSRVSEFSEAYYDLDNVIDLHFYHWEHKPQPTCTV